MITIRKAVPADALGIAIVCVYTWQTTYAGLLPDSILKKRISGLKETAERFRKSIAEKENYIVAATEENTIVGFCAYAASRNDDFPDSGEIIALYVLKGFQKTGLGKRLFAAGVQVLREQNFSSMILNCLDGNPSVGFYQHMGGRIAAQRQDKMKDSVITENILYFQI